MNNSASGGHGEIEKKGSHHVSSHTSWSCIGSIIIVIGIVIVGFNYWHAMKCVESNGLEDSHEYIAAMNQRIVDIEYQVKLAQEKTQKLVRELQEKVLYLDERKIQTILEQSKDTAIRTALLLETQPSPPQTQYLVDDKNTNEIGSKWDDLFNEFGEGAKTQYDDPLWEESTANEFKSEELDMFDDDFSKSQSEFREENIENFRKGQKNPSELLIECKEWKEKYHVVIGVSWGELPSDLQVQWKESDCDYYLSTP